MKPFKIHRFTIIIIIALTAASCSTQKHSIIGTWTSTSISNPAPFFKNTLPDNTPGIVIFSADENGTFTWQNKKEKNIIEGKFTLSGNQLNLEGNNEKPVKLKVIIDADKMSLLTNDGFTFAFRRSLQ